MGHNGNSNKNNENTLNEYSNINDSSIGYNMENKKITSDNNTQSNRNSNSLLGANKFSKNSTKNSKDNTSLFEKLNSSVNLKRSATTY